MSLTPEPKTTDEVILAVREIKKSLAQAFDFDLHRMLEEARNKQRTGGREIIAPPAPSRAAEAARP